jgi:voltage-gated potassium channel
LLATDYLVRLTLAADRGWFVRHSVVDLMAVLVPFLWVFLVARIFKILSRTGQRRFADRLTAYAAYLTLILLIGGSLLVVSFERGQPGSNIKTFGQGLWWGLVTIATVGYGDYVPITWQGRVVASLMIAAGVALVTIVTASLASRFIARAAPDEPGLSFADVIQRLDQIDRRIDELARRDRD